MRTRFLTGAAALVCSALLACGAYAQKTPANFGGFYVGAQVGYGITSADGGATVGGTTVTFDEDEGGVNGGLYAGYGVQLGKFYVGGEVDASLSSAEYEETSGGITGTIEQKHTLGAGVRLGYQVTSSALLYGRVGVVQTSFDASATDGTTTVSDDDSLTGVRFGAGIEVAANEHVSLRFEYTRTDYEEETYSNGTDSATVDVDEDLFRVGAAWRF